MLHAQSCVCSVLCVVDTERRTTLAFQPVCRLYTFALHSTHTTLKHFTDAAST